MRKINAKKIETAVEQLFSKANFFLPKDVLNAIEKAEKNEKNKLSKYVLDVILENSRIAQKEKIPLCQDTGIAVLFLEIGQNVLITGKPLQKAIDDGIRKAVKKNFFRASVVKDPLERINTKNNTPAIVHTEIIPGSKIKMYLLAKGGGAENMSALKMLKPSDGEKGVVDFVVKTVKEAGPNPCPPIIVGVGIGGNFEKCAYIAKKALLRKIGKSNPKNNLAKLEKEILQKINSLHIGPSGFGGKNTCLAVNIESLPCHIASLPVAVNIECHSHRHYEAVL